ncbi:MAG: hypothetical protein LBU51_01090 [Bacteroidales bacterium]|jgi:hypothetical protein|nr:hypothetical protein [Bacteroidales bacterium]
MEKQIVNDDATLWKESREIPIQEYSEPTVSDNPEFVSTETDSEKPHFITDKEVKSNYNSIKISEPTANLIVSLINVIFPAIVCKFTKGKADDKDNLKLEEDEKEVLVDAFSQWLSEKQVNMSPTAVLLTAIAGIYTPKIIDVFFFKTKENEENIKQYIQQLEYQNSILKKNDEPEN